VVELLSRMQAADHPALGRLGPDLLAPDFDAAAALRRLRVRARLPIAEALLDQGALAGIGNVFKSEVLHLCGVDPFARVELLDDATLERLIDTARAQLVRNRGRFERRTTTTLAPVPFAVYGRGRRECRRCGAAIRRVVHGELPRSTWWCPACQPPQTAPGAEGLAPERREEGEA
jgi:endonuclease-8